MENRNNHRLNIIIEQFIKEYDGTVIGQSVRNMYENGCDYASICDRMNIDCEECEEE